MQAVQQRRHCNPEEVLTRMCSCCTMTRLSTCLCLTWACTCVCVEHVVCAGNSLSKCCTRDQCLCQLLLANRRCQTAACPSPSQLALNFQGELGKLLPIDVRGRQSVLLRKKKKKVCTCSGKCSQGASMLLRRLPTSLPNCFRRARSARHIGRRATRCLPEPLPLKRGVETAARRKAPRSIELNATAKCDAHCGPTPIP